jgi:hypothetical protein
MKDRTIKKVQCVVGGELVGGGGGRKESKVREYG